MKSALIRAFVAVLICVNPRNLWQANKSEASSATGYAEQVVVKIVNLFSYQ